MMADVHLPPGATTGHDPYCPKSFPTKIFPDPETGDPWSMGPSKLLCQCGALAAARASGLGGLELRMAHVRSQLGEGTAGVTTTPEEAGRLEDLDRVLDRGTEVIRREDLWDWLCAPNAAFGGAIPLDLIAAGEHERVVDLLGALGEGVTS